MLVYERAPCSGRGVKALSCEVHYENYIVPFSYLFPMPHFKAYRQGVQETKRLELGRYGQYRREEEQLERQYQHVKEQQK